MSVFKIKPWWSNSTLHEDLQTGAGSQSPGCLKVDKFEHHTESDCVILGEERFIRIYKPNKDQNVSDILLETELGDFILHIETGKFIGGSTDRQIIVLHPLSYVVYQFEKTDGKIDAGDQHLLKTITKQTFTRKSYCLVCGPFGNIKTRDLICIQGLDGSLSFFDQETFLFMCLFNDVIISGPVCYVPSSDLFVIGKSTWILEIYSYQQLREFSETALRQNKKNLPQWAYNAGEEVSGVQAIQTSTNFSTIIALGERHLYCFQDNGLMKYMIKFDYMPLCFCAYLIGWYYEPTSRLVVMVASDDSKLYVYESTTLLWMCDLLEPAILITRCFLKSLSGGLVTLSPKGITTINYLGTEPDLNSSAGSMLNETFDPEKDQEKLKVVEEELQVILEDKGEGENSSQGVLQILKINADVGKPTQDFNKDDFRGSDETAQSIMCPLVVMLSCEEPKFIQNIQITYACCQPFTCSESTISLDGVNGTEIIESQIFLSSGNDISDVKVEVVFTITDSVGKILVTIKKVLLPISLFCSPTTVENNKQLKINIVTNHPMITSEKILTDFPQDELTNMQNSEDTVTLETRISKKNVTIKVTDNQYTLEADDFPEITAILEHVTYKLTDHYIRMGVEDFKFNIKFSKDLSKQITHRFLKSVEAHAKGRIKLKGQEDELNILQKQFTIIQKRLLVQYGSLPPGDCEPLEFLMRDTHERLKNSVNEILESRESIRSIGSTIMSIGRLIIIMLKQTSLEPFKVELVEETLCLGTLYEDYQDWEEAVIQSLFYILNKVLNNKEKGKEKLAAITEQGTLSLVNLKRFIKQIKILLDKLFLEAYSEETEPKLTDSDNKVTRIEELVEVL